MKSTLLALAFAGAVAFAGAAHAANDFPLPTPHMVNGQVSFPGNPAATPLMLTGGAMTGPLTGTSHILSGALSVGGSTSLGFTTNGFNPCAKSQGLQVDWNASGGRGEVDITSCYGATSSGFDFYKFGSGTANTLLATLNSSGIFLPPGVGLYSGTGGYGNLGAQLIITPQNTGPNFAQIQAALIDGTITTPDMTAAYNNPVLMIERITGSSTATQFAAYGNQVLEPAEVIEVYGMAASTNAIGALSLRTQALYGNATCTTAQTNANTCQNLTTTLTAISVVGAPSSGQTVAHQGFAANFIAQLTGGGNPTNNVGLEIDMITALNANGNLPGAGDNYTAYWAQSASGNNLYNTAGLYISSQFATGGWSYGVVGVTNFKTAGVFIQNTLNAAGANGIVAQITSAAATSYLFEGLSGNGTKEFSVDGEGNLVLAGGITTQNLLATAGVLGVNYYAGASNTPGVSCGPTAPSTSFTTVSGIVTHC